MTDQALKAAVEPDYVLMKRGLFYRPNSMGYTGIKEHAGRYTKADAESHADPLSGVTAMPFDEAPLIAPNCFDDIARDYLIGCLENRDALIAAQAAALSSQASVMEEMAKGLDASNANHEKFERLWYLEQDKVARLKLAICGGEDVPGAIDAVSVEDCEGFIAEERSRHIDTEAGLEYVRRSRDGAADRADRLYRALVEVRDSVETYPLDDSQTCMCGSPVEGHNVGSGHAPVSQADHAISLIVEAIDKALGIAVIPDDALIGAGRSDDYEGPDVGMHDTEIVESEND